MRRTSQPKAISWKKEMKMLRRIGRLVLWLGAGSLLVDLGMEVRLFMVLRLWLGN